MLLSCPRRLDSGRSPSGVFALAGKCIPIIFQFDWQIAL